MRFPKYCLYIFPLFVALCCSAAAGEVRDNANASPFAYPLQIAERAKQYQESLQKRTAEVMPAGKTQIESQIKQTVTAGLAKWQRGELSLAVALPKQFAAQCAAWFVAAHTPYSGSPHSASCFGGGTMPAVLTVTPVPVVKTFFVQTVIPIIHAAMPMRSGSDILTHAVLVVRTAVLRL